MQLDKPYEKIHRAKVSKWVKQYVARMRDEIAALVKNRKLCLKLDSIKLLQGKKEGKVQTSSGRESNFNFFCT